MSESYWLDNYRPKEIISESQIKISLINAGTQ